METNRYDIRNGLWGQAIYNGPKKKGNWNLNITRNKSLRFATIHRAAYRYFHKNIGGLNRPCIFGNGNSKIKLSYYHRANNNGSLGDFNPMFGGGGVLTFEFLGKE